MKKYRYTITSIYGETLEDNYNSGLIERSGFQYDTKHFINTSWDSLGDLIDGLKHAYCLSVNPFEIKLIEDGKIEIYLFANKDGEEPSTKEVNAWKKDNGKLYETRFEVKVIKTDYYTPDITELQNDLLTEGIAEEILSVM